MYKYHIVLDLEMNPVATGSFGARNPKQYANSYFGDAFVRFSWDHPDYMHIKVSGTLNDIHIEEVKKVICDGKGGFA